MGDVRGILSAGLVHESVGRQAEAAEVYRRGLETFPHNAELTGALRRTHEGLRAEAMRSLTGMLDHACQMWMRIREYDRSIESLGGLPTAAAAAAAPPLPTIPSIHPLSYPQPQPASFAPPSYPTPRGSLPGGGGGAPHVHHAPMIVGGAVGPRVGRDDVVAAHEQQHATRTRTTATEPSSKLFVALPRQTTEQQVRDAFAWLPGYTGASLISNQDGTSKGFAFVRFNTAREANEAREYMDGLTIAQLGPRALCINFSTPPVADYAEGTAHKRPRSPAG